MCLSSQKLFRRKKQRDLGYTAMTTKMKVMTHIKNDGLHSTNLILAERPEGLVHQHKVSDRKFQFRTQMTERRMITKPECGIMMVGKIKEE